MPHGHVRLCLRVALSGLWLCAWALFPARVVAQEPKLTETVTAFSEFLGKFDAGAASPARISVECDVLYYDPDWGQLWVRDAHGPAFVSPGRARLSVRHGQRIRVTGELNYSGGDLSLEGMSIEGLGAIKIEPVVVDDSLARQNLPTGTFVEIRAMVDQQVLIDERHLSLSLSAHGGKLRAWIPIDPQAARADLVGRSIRLRGVFNPTRNTRGEVVSVDLNVPGIDSIVLLNRIEDDLRFETPAVAIGDISESGGAGLVRVVGVVQAQTAETGVPLRDSTGEVDLVFAQNPAPAPNEEIEAVGTPVWDGTRWKLTNTIFRRRHGEMTQAGSTRAQVPGPVKARVQVIQGFWNLTPEERAQVQTIDLECDVLHYDPAWGMLWLRDSTAGAYVPIGKKPLPIRSGQRIHVKGTLAPPNRDLVLADASFEVLGDVLVDAVPLGDWRMLNPALENRIVVAQGLVDRQSFSRDDPTHFRLFLSADGRLLVAWIVVEADAPIPNLTGAIVRVRGIYNPKASENGLLTGLEVMVAGLDRVEVIGRLDTYADFQRPAVPIESLHHLPSGDMIRVVGHVRSQQSGRSVRLRDATGEVEVMSAQTAVLAVGDAVEAIGFPQVVGLDARLTGAMFRRIVKSAEIDDGDALRTLLYAAAVLELSPEDAEARRPVQLMGVVTWAHPHYPYFYLQDGSAGVRVQRGPDPEGIVKPARSIQAIGVTAMGRFAPEVQAHKLARVSTTVPPEAPMVSLEQALTGVEEAQWVAMRGYLRAVERRTHVSGQKEQVLHLATATGDFEALLPTEDDLTPVLGAVVRLRGVCTAQSDATGKLTGIQLLVNDATFLQVEEPAPADVFQMPVRSLETIGRFAATHAFNRRVKVEGTVVYATPGRFIIHDGGVSLVALTREDVLPRPGERVEAVGFLGRQGPRVVLRETVHRPLSPGSPLAPEPLGDLRAVDPGRDGKLVQISGSVLDAAHVGSALILTVQRGTAVFPAQLDGARPAVRKGSEVQLTGVYDVRYDEYGQARSFALLLRDGNDLLVTRQPSPFTTRRVLTFTGILAAATLGIVGWVVALRRRVRRQTEQIRDQIRREAELERRLEQAQRLESLGLLAGGIAHDFNNLLTVVMGNISLARCDAALDGETRDSLGDAERAIARARDLTQQLLTFSKGGAPIRAAVDLEGVVREVAGFVLRGSSVRAEFDVMPGLWTADVDKGQVAQVVQNIVINAAQAMPGGGRIEISLANEEVVAGARPGLETGRYLRLVVQDHGPGIRAGDLSRIFDPYFTTKTKGSGLGLATVYSIVKRHGGDITVTSEIGRGSCFQVWLPAVEPSGAGVAAPVSQPAATPHVGAASVRERSAAGPVRVLVMDDEEAIQKLARTILRRAGYDVTVVGDGAEAVREYVAARDAGCGYALVVFDLTVPGGMGGRQALEVLRRTDPQIRAIVSSGYSNDPSLADHRGLGFAAMVAKPYEASTLVGTVQAVLASGGA